MTEWLPATREALDTTRHRCPIFFRDDDAGWATPRLSALLDLFDHHGVPIDLAVIPTAITPRLARELQVRAARCGVRLHQYGYAHVNHEPEGRKCEFGARRDPAEQARDIAAGRKRLIDALGPVIDPVFTPPWNRCTESTAYVLAAQGIEVLSRDVTAAPLGPTRLVEVPVTLDWFGRRKGVRWTRAELDPRLADGVASGGPVGVMLHHAHIDSVEREALGDLLRLVAAHPAARSTTIVELADQPRAGLLDVERSSASHPG